MLGASLVAVFALARLTTGATGATVTAAAVGTVVVALLRRRAALAVGLAVVAVGVTALVVRAPRLVPDRHLDR